MNEFHIGSLQLLGRSDHDFTLFAPIDGLDFPSMRVSSYNRPGEDGGIVSNVFYGMRSVSITGMVMGSNCEQYEDNRQLLVEACSTNKDEFGYPTLTRFVAINTAGESFYFDGQVTNVSVLRGGLIKASEFQISVIVPDHTIYSSTSSSSGSIVRQSGTGFEWPFDWPILWGTTSGGTATLNNTGNVEVYPVITITGSATSPYILNSTTDKFIQLNYTFDVSDVLVIDMGAKTVLLNGTTNLISAKTSASDWWSLVPGNNVINYTTSTSSDTGTVEVTWHNGFVGI